MTGPSDTLPDPALGDEQIDVLVRHEQPVPGVGDLEIALWVGTLKSDRLPGQLGDGMKALSPVADAGAPIG